MADQFGNFVAGSGSVGLDIESLSFEIAEEGRLWDREVTLTQCNLVADDTRPNFEKDQMLAGKGGAGQSH